MKDRDTVHPESPFGAGLGDALRFLKAQNRAPGPDDRPPPSTFPMTDAAREALRYDKQARRPVSKKRREELTHGSDE